MKQNKKHGILIIITLALLCMTGIKLHRILSTWYLFEPISIRYQSDGVTIRELNTASQNELEKGNQNLPDITAWNYENKIKLQNPVLSRQTVLPLAVVYGNMLHTVPMKLISGNYPYKEDLFGCIVDEDTAYELFGNSNILGNIVVYDKKDYYVRGVVKTNRRIFMIQSDGNELKFKNLELLFQERENQEKTAQEFLFQNGLESEYLAIDGYVYQRFLWSLSILPFWALYIWCGIIILREAKLLRISNTFWKKLTFLCAGAGILAVIGFMLYHWIGSPFYLPAKYIPSKWSDFEHWSNLYRNITNTLQDIQYLNSNPKDILLLGIISDFKPNSILFTGISMLLGIFVHRLIKLAKERV